MLYHQSGEAISEIDIFEPFFIFFSHADIYTFKANYLYEIDEDKLNIIDADRFFYHKNCDKLNEIVKEVIEEFSCNESQAERLLSNLYSRGIFEILGNDIDFIDLLEKDDWLDKKRGECARILGFDGVYVGYKRYVIDMLNKKELLKLV